MGSFYMESTQINYRRDETVKTVDQKLQELSETVESETTNTYDFSTPSGYNAGGRIISDKKGKVVILRFIDYVPTCPSGKVELLSGLPAATNGQSTQFYNPVSNAFFKPLIDTDGKLYSYYTGDLTSNTAPFTGQLVYFTN